MNFTRRRFEQGDLVVFRGLKRDWDLNNGRGVVIKVEDDQAYVYAIDTNPRNYIAFVHQRHIQHARPFMPVFAQLCFFLAIFLIKVRE